MIRALLGIVALAGCIDWNGVQCPDGRVCPTGYQCDDAYHTCYSPEQVGACAGLGDGAECLGSTFSGICHDGGCDVPRCGDGIQAGNEQCDGADLGGKT